MKYILSAITVILLLGTSGCATGRYPLSGQKCGTCDPVKGMCAPDCPQITAG